MLARMSLGVGRNGETNPFALIYLRELEFGAKLR